MRLVPMEGDRFHLSAEEAVKALRREHHRRRRHPRLDLRRRLRAGRRHLRRARRATKRSPAWTSRCTSTARPAPSSPRSSTPICSGTSGCRGWLDQHLRPQVRAGLPRRRLDHLARRRRAARGPGLPGQLPRRQHADFRAELLPPRRTGRRRSTTTSCASASTGYTQGAGLRPRRGDPPVRPDRRARPVPAAHPGRPAARVRLHAQDDIDNFTVFDVSDALRERGWQVPAYTFPKNREDLAALRFVVRRGFSHDLADMLIADLKRQLPRLETAAASARRRRRHRIPSLTTRPMIVLAEVR